MRFPGKWPTTGDTPGDRQAARVAATDQLRIRGTPKRPDAPTDLIAQSASRGVLLSWGQPVINTDIVGWRIYKGDENTMYTEIRDRGNRQCFVEATAGSSPPTNNFFVSSINAFGKESRKVQIQAKASTENGAPSVPGAPPGFTSGAGADTSNHQGKISQFQ